MASRRVSRKQLIQGCAEPGVGDGQDPRLDRHATPATPAGRKAWQLCGQIARALASLLGTLGDEALRDLTVQSVSPAAGKGRVLVTLSPAASAAPRDRAEWLSAVERFAPLARREAAAAIHRRRVPDLVIQVTT